MSAFDSVLDPIADSNLTVSVVTQSELFNLAATAAGAGFGWVTLGFATVITVMYVVRATFFPEGSPRHVHNIFAMMLGWVAVVFSLSIWQNNAYFTTDAAATFETPANFNIYFAGPLLSISIFVILNHIGGGWDSSKHPDRTTLGWMNAYTMAVLFSVGTYFVFLMSGYGLYNMDLSQPYQGAFECLSIIAIVVWVILVLAGIVFSIIALVQWSKGKVAEERIPFGNPVAISFFLVYLACLIAVGITYACGPWVTGNTIGQTTTLVYYDITGSISVGVYAIAVVLEFVYNFLPARWGESGADTLTGSAGYHEMQTLKAEMEALKAEMRNKASNKPSKSGSSRMGSNA